MHTMPCLTNHRPVLWGVETAMTRHDPAPFVALLPAEPPQGGSVSLPHRVI